MNDYEMYDVNSPTQRRLRERYEKAEADLRVHRAWVAAHPWRKRAADLAGAVGYLIESQLADRLYAFSRLLEPYHHDSRS